MKDLKRVVLLIGLVIWTSGSASVAAPVYAAEKSDAAMEICAVCAVREGSSHAEAVVARRTYNDVSYAFCNTNCAAEFDADPAAFARPVLPRPVPAADMALVDLEGKAVTWKRFAGTLTLVDFWATWCVPCRKSMPELQALHAKYAGKGFGVLGIATDDPGKDSAKKIRKFVKDQKITYPIAHDAGDKPVWEAFRVKAVPAAYLVDGEGRIVAQWTGRAPTAEEIEAEIGKRVPKGD